MLMLKEFREASGLKIAQVAERAGVPYRGAAPDSVQLPYWTSQDAYDRHHYVDDGGDWRMANATNRMLAERLHERGIRVEWTDGPTVPRMG